MVNPDNTIKYIQPDERDNTSDDEHIAPVRPTDQATKDFKKVLGKSSKEGDAKAKKSPASIFSGETTSHPTEEIGVEKEDQEKATEGVFTVFDLSKKKEKVAQKPVQPSSNVAKADTKAESPNDLFKRMSSVHKEAAEMEPHQKEKEKKLSSIYQTEQGDLSTVNPMAAFSTRSIEPSSSNFSSKVERVADVDSNMALLIEQVIKHMYTVQKEGQTDTVITLQYPPLFKDAKLTLSAFDTAKGQFNITFENLTQQAQKVLENQTNKQTLFTALEQKGYNVHIFTATTVQIENLNLAEQQSSHDREEERQGGSPEHRQRQG